MNYLQVTDKLYASFGTDSGILFGIKERRIVETIVKFSLQNAPPINWEAYDQLRESLTLLEGRVMMSEDNEHEKAAFISFGEELDQIRDNEMPHDLPQDEVIDNQ